MDPSASGASRPARPRHWPVCALMAGLVVFHGWSDSRLRPEPPDPRQQIAATLTSWGLNPQTDGALPDAAEIAWWVSQLKSPGSEQRVRAARWLGRRGIRPAGPAMAAALHDDGTRRPCQLAHELGRLGDEQWVPILLNAAGRSQNTDLQVCALIALGDLASAEATTGLIELYRREGATTPGFVALRTLGEIADPAASEFLRSVAAEATNIEERRMAGQALARIGIVIEDDPVPSLMQRVAAGEPRALDVWAVRRLAVAHDERAVPVLARALARPDLFDEHRVALAAALTRFGAAGARALADPNLPASVKEIATAGLGLIETRSRTADAQDAGTGRTAESPPVG